MGLNPPPAAGRARVRMGSLHRPLMVEDPPTTCARAELEQAAVHAASKQAAP